ncbi:unnamed protein product [Enterobius vermicularis]|uniref:Uncharacterized protein n=1 Tax=Enterobius vermicularis TaxID=51028 RepID=A0A0N4USU3_ENTVE|nr:unnamed protein product [Enterobius vermicularis]
MNSNNSTGNLFDKESMINKIQQSSRSSTMFQNVLLSFLLTAFLLFVLCVVLTGVMSEKGICCRLCRRKREKNLENGVSKQPSSSSEPSISRWETVGSELSSFTGSLLGMKIDGYLENGLIRETGKLIF